MMRRLCPPAAALLISAASLQAQDQWWCGGDGFMTGLGSERNTTVADARTYDDFDVLLRSTVRGAWGNFLFRNVMPTRAYYEIRSGITVGHGGTLHAAGEMNVQAVPTGRVIKTMYEHLVRGQFPEPVTLDPGHYWITVAPIGQGSGRCFVSDTRAWDEPPTSDPTPPPMGTPHANGQSFFDSSYFGCTFVDTQEVMGSGRWDFAFGVGPSTGPPIRFRPEKFEVTFGDYIEGGLEDLFEDDANAVRIGQRLYPRISAPNAQLVLESTIPLQVGYLCVNSTSCTSGAPREAILQRIALFDFQAQRWTTVDERPGDRTGGCPPATGAATIEVERFIEPGTRRVRAAVSWIDRGSAALNWSAYIDQIAWVVEPQ